MAASEKKFAIVFDDLSDERREVIQEIVKERTDSWWHNFPNVWVVAGSDAIAWRDAVRPVIKGTSASVLVLMVPDTGERPRWAGFGPNIQAKMDWFKKNV